MKIYQYLAKRVYDLSEIRIDQDEKHHKEKHTDRVNRESNPHTHGADGVT